MAGVLQARGEPEAAFRLLGAADGLLEEVGARRLIHAAALDPRMTAVRALHEDALTTDWEQGRTSAPDQVVAQALALAEALAARTD